LLLLGWVSAVAGAQVPLPQPLPQPQEPQPPQVDPMRQELPSRPRPQGDPLDPIWVAAPKVPLFQGFPVFPLRLSGYGTGYPRRPGELEAGGLLPPLPVVPVAEEETGWPGWARARSKAPLVYAPDKALLVRHSDRVWWKAPDEDAFVPLYFHDKLRVVDAGTEVEVRQAGGFEVLLHGGSRIGLLGRSALRIDSLGEAKIELTLASLTLVRLDAVGRECVVHLPDGSVLTVAADSAEDPAGPGSVVIDRAIEPGWLGGRATMFNGGARPVQWKHAFGTVTVAPGEKIDFFLTPPKVAVAGELETGESVASPDGPAMTCVAERDAVVSWSGARFRLSGGSRLRLDPLLGTPFAPAVEKTPTAPVR